VATPANATTSTGQTQTLAPTDSSVDVGEVTPALTEGPYFKPNSPERTSILDPGMAGTKLTLTGKVLSTHAQPIAKALLDFWQADNGGAYDNSGYTLRGHQFTTADGQYQLTTVIPGLYPGRTRHIHVKLQAPNQPVLTTQLFFPNESQNSSDGIFNSKLVLPIKDAADGSKVATFNFVLNVG
jgi:protocatechuate 3,4-dioxygenase beta subunit